MDGYYNITIIDTTDTNTHSIYQSLFPHSFDTTLSSVDHMAHNCGKGSIDVRMKSLIISLKLFCH